MAARRRVTPSSGNRPLAVLRGRMRSLQREAEAILERRDEETPRSNSQSIPKRLLKASQLGEGVDRVTGLGRSENEGRGERLLSGLERELMRRLKSVLERLDLPNRRELEELDERVRGLEKRLNEQPSTKRTTKRRTHRRKPSPR